MTPIGNRVLSNVPPGEQAEQAKTILKRRKTGLLAVVVALGTVVHPASRKRCSNVRCVRLAADRSGYVCENKLFEIYYIDHGFGI
jgi:hypothetical protein